MSKYMKITEFAREIGVSAATLRVWEKKGYLLPHHYTPAGYRVYTSEQLEQYFRQHQVAKDGRG